MIAIMATTSLMLLSVLYTHTHTNDFGVKTELDSITT